MQLKFTILSLLSATGAFAQYHDGAVLQARKNKGLENTNGTTLRIMPVGASITWGTGSSKGNGYRKKLRELLVKEGNPVNMVGTRKNGDFKDNDNEGWPGLIIDEVRDKALSNSSAPKFKPNIYLVHVGTNDAAKDKDVSKAGERYERLINDLLDKSNKSVVIASTLIHNRKEDVDKRINDINEQYKKVVAKLQKDNKRVLIVDMAGPDGPETKKEADQYADDTHPNDKGYDRMAELWLKGIKDAARRKWIQKPQWSMSCNGPKLPGPFGRIGGNRIPSWFSNTCSAPDSKKINEQVKKDIINERPKWANDVEKKIIDELKKHISDLKNQIKDELKKDLKCKN